MDKIIGHEKIKKRLEEILKTQKINHAYIFEGISGIGKFEVAKEFARAILCHKKETKPCLQCKSCLMAENHPDYAIILPEEGSIKIEQIRKFSEEVVLKPIVSERKVYLINDAELMTEQAQNALLKILEEPPIFTVIILITANINKILKTIRSRCTTIKFNELKEEEIKEYLIQAGINQEMVKYARGSIGKALELSKKNYFEVVDRLIFAISKKDILQMYKMLELIKKEKDNLDPIFDYMIYYYFDHIRKDYKQYASYIEIIENCKNNLKRNANLDITLDNAMIKLWKV